MGYYRLESIAELSRQMRFTPISRRLQQLAATEELLLQLSPDQTCTLSQVICAITGYEPRQPDHTLLTGEALQHDLGLLLEQVSDSLQLHVNSSAEPILTIDDAAQRFGITTKTIQRWRRRGLPARRFIFNDGKRRIGFRLSSVQRFIGTSARLDLTPTTTYTPHREIAWIITCATRLAAQGFWPTLVGHRLVGLCDLSPVAIAQILRTQGGALGLAEEPSAELRRRVIELVEAGQSLTQVADALHLPKLGVYRIVLEQRIHRLQRKPLRFIDDPLYHQNDALQAIEQIVGQQTLETAPAAEAIRIPRDLPAYLRELYRTPLLSATQERGLFLKFHYLRYLAAQMAQQLDPQLSRWSQVRQVRALLQQATEVKNQLTTANLRLVVSVARKHLRPELALMDLVSEGNVILLRAVDSFDIHRGRRFAAYGVYALMKGFARCIPTLLAQHGHATDPELLAEQHDPLAHLTTHHTELRDEISHLFSRLDPFERDILAARFGLGAAPQSSTQLGSRMNLSRQRIIQIEHQALAKLRGMVVSHF